MKIRVSEEVYTSYDAELPAGRTWDDVENWETTTDDNGRRILSVEFKDGTKTPLVLEEGSTDVLRALIENEDGDVLADWSTR